MFRCLKQTEIWPTYDMREAFREAVLVLLVFVRRLASSLWPYHT